MRSFGRAPGANHWPCSEVILKILLDDGLGGDAAQTDDDFGLQQGGLAAEPADAGLLLHIQGVPVLGAGGT